MNLDAARAPLVEEPLQALFDFGRGLPQHIGVLRESVTPGAAFQTIEGNTSSGPGGSQDNGGGLYARADRTTATAKWFVRAS